MLQFVPIGDFWKYFKNFILGCELGIKAEVLFRLLDADYIQKNCKGTFVATKY